MDGDNSQILVKCYAGCSQMDVINGLKGYGAWPEYEKAKPKEKQKRKQVASYDYITQAGELLFQVIRYEPKDFRQRAPDGDGWKWSVKHLKELVPYRLPQLLESDKAIFICEGEKDADNLAQLGVTATTFAQGAGKWRSEYEQWFRGRHVVLLPDNDPQGLEHMNQVAAKLKGQAKSTRICPLPGLPPKGDVSDWIAAGGTKQDLAGLVKATPEWMPPSKPSPVSTQNDPAPAPITQDQARAVLGFIDFPDVTDKGRIKATIPNLATLLRHYQITIRYNVISKQPEVLIPGTSFSLDNYDNCAIAHIESLAASHGLPVTKVQDFMGYIADANQYNPAAIWIESKPWDGVNRFPALVESLDSKNPDLTQIWLWRWLIGAVAAVYEPRGIDNSSVLVLQGEQYLGNTSWFWSLLGNNPDLGKESAIINPHDKDTVLQAIEYWLVELGELDATFRKSDIAALKGFISRSRDEIRRPFGRTNSKYPRRTMFFASVNPKYYLSDEQNRRFWTIQCGDKLNPNHGIDVQQLWAQVKAQYDKGARWKLTKEEVGVLNEYNEGFKAADPIEELILKHYDPSQDLYRGNKMSASDVLISIGYERPTLKQARDCATYLRKIFKQEPTRNGGRLVFDLPGKKDTGYPR